MKPHPDPLTDKPAETQRPIESQAEGFATVRNAHESEMAEDYVELIAELIALRGEARPVDIAERFGVKPPTVSKNLTRLQRDGLVCRERYRSVFLTKPGQKLADHCRARHRLVVKFLLALGIPAEVAERDAEGIEHHVSDETLEAFGRFVSDRAE
ncbi:manganese-binding transcriptional regulator MntR [Sulfitobacter sp. CW3]|uniref:manganese-binding transcriptional regulator MntR n=1 Tax=Sulfitobacter sp. CW3 TaxID=2861965 RepID=UPI001C5F42EF|nr:manganese-binding transcriptional regulator MntR [Sulfitobacter sp. CW3]MBW4964109.1 manganese-binding transcriptional regulator MntR [Sulfitobacter sp. CW3]